MGCAGLIGLVVVVGILIAALKGGTTTAPGGAATITPSGTATPSTPAAARASTAPPTPPATPTSAPQPIVFTADGDKATPPFHISSDSWTIAYTVTAAGGASCADVLASIYAYPKGDTSGYVANADKNGCGADSTEAQGSGDFYLKFLVANAHLRVVVTQH